jgi:glycosyltransferase involved in cell wall biosynthesis
VLSKNFGSFAAIRAGLATASGPHYAVMAADLQEPPELIQAFFHALEQDEADVVVGAREGRADPLATRFSSEAFWWLYRKLVHPEIPPGGIDVFGCNQRFRDEVLRLEESHTSLVGLICWLGFRRKVVPYRRLARKHGRSAWSLRRKMRYLLDSVFSFTDLPIRLLGLAGGIGLVASLLVSAIVLVARALSWIEVPGYTPTILVVSLLGSLNLLSFGIVGSYVWRTYENTKRRPDFVVMEALEFGRDRGSLHPPGRALRE